MSSTAPEQVISEVVTLLRPDTDYAVNVAALNQFGAGVPATVAVRTLPHHVGALSRPFTSDLVRLLSVCTWKIYDVTARDRISTNHSRLSWFVR